MLELLLNGAGVAAILGLALSFASCLALMATQRWHGRYSFDTLIGAQKFHSAPTLRIGGLAIAAGVLGSAVFASESHAVLWPLLIAAMPAFAAGLAEDFTKQVGVRLRLLATIASGLIICLLTGITISHVDIPGLDWLLTFSWIALPVTAIVIAGVANALNIIDGFNGLAGGVAVISLLAYMTLALAHGDIALAGTCLLFASALLGFLAVNFPFGRIFLGDGGAYFTGFGLAWIAVLLIARNPEISPWAAALLVIYPVTEMVFSIWRKHRRHGHHPSQPDRLHLHMLLHKRVAKKLFHGASPALQNGLTAPLGWLLALAPAIVAVVYPHSTPLLAASLLLFVFAYSAIYARLTQFRWCLRPATMRNSLGGLKPKGAVQSSS